MKTYVIYDVESYINFFSCTFVDHATGTRWIFEVSDRRNQSREFIAFIYWIASIPGARMVGFNNLHYDYPLIHFLVNLGYFTAFDAYQKSQAIFGSADRFEHSVWQSDEIVEQVDLFKIHHFDNVARATSLKAIEIARGSWNVIDLPFSPHEPLTFQQMDHMIVYNCHDVSETRGFFVDTLESIEFRDQIGTEFGFNCLNFNDTKIGKQYFTEELEKASPGITGTKTRPKKINQTHRPVINLNDVILPCVGFNHPELQRVLDYLRNQKITETKGVFTGLSAEIDGFKFDFGTGGVHGSRHNETFIEDDHNEIIDIDVASYYPSLAIVFRLFPAHLSELFCDLNKELFDRRVREGKKSLIGKIIKLALNGTYGDSNSVYSCFYDPQYTMAITINGQLLLCMLAEYLMTIPGLHMMQINTDGMTARVPRNMRATFLERCAEWEAMTGLELENVNYRRMFIRDVNNYIAEPVEGDIKRKGDFGFIKIADDPKNAEVLWNKDHSSLVVPMAVSEYLINGTSITDFICNHPNHLDFCRTGKCDRKSRIETTDGEPLQKINRYHIAIDGPGMVKVMPPLAKKPGVERRIGIDVGFSVNVCNDIRDFDWNRLNRSWYINQAEKLAESVGT